MHEGKGYMNEFTVTTGNKNETELKELTKQIALYDILCRQYHNAITITLEKHNKIDEWSQDELMQVVK